MTTSDSSKRGTVNGGTIAATFPDRDSANKALTELHHAGFRDVWLGVTQGDATAGTDATVASVSAAGEEAEEQVLHKALIAHGLKHDQARRVKATLRSGAAIVTVGGENDPDEAREILQNNGGNVDTDSVGPATAGTPKVDDARRLELREERLLIDTQRVARGEARIRKEVVSERQSIDVPVFHEELFIRHVPVSEGATAATPIGEEGEEIRIPLNEERVDVQKRTVVTEKVEVGKRKVEGTEHVSETVRREELHVDDDGRPATSSTPRP